MITSTTSFELKKVMKKEYLYISMIGLFILSLVLDWMAGPLELTIKNPFSFLSQPIISNYPFTAFSVLLKIIVILVTIITFLLLISEKQLAKGVFLIFLTALLELYSFQQLATGNQMVSLPWSLAIAFSGVLLLIPATTYIIIGLLRLLHRQITKEPYDVVTKGTEEPDL